MRASSNSISGSSPGGWPQHVPSASQVAPESCIRGEPFSFMVDFYFPEDLSFVVINIPTILYSLDLSTVG